MAQNTNLSFAQAVTAANIINDFKDILVKELDKSRGHSDTPPHEIDTGDHLPIFQNPYPTNPIKTKAIEEEVRIMLERGIIARHQGAWAAPVNLQLKKDGSWRFCIDYRKLNAATHAERWPLPHTESIIESLHGKKVFSSLDLASGFWQIAMSPEASVKAAFITKSGLYRPLVLPFGLKNASAAFQRALNWVLRDYIGKFCHVYIDDVLIFSETPEQHAEHVRLVLQSIKDANMQLRLKKCVWFASEVDYLGHHITTDGIRATEFNKSKIRACVPPKNLRDLRSFLGLTGYYRRFIKDYAIIASPLTALLKADTKWHWDTEQQAAFTSLIDILTRDSTLAIPSYDGRPFILDTDASNFGMGAVLSQEFDGVERPIAFWSSTYDTVRQSDYSATDREMLAILRGVTHFHHIVEGVPLLVRTDHQPLTYIFGAQMLPPGMRGRWLSKLQAYDLTIKYRAGTANGNADACSRPPIVSPSSTSPPVITFDTQLPETRIIATVTDSALISYISTLEDSHQTVKCSSFIKWLDSHSDEAFVASIEEIPTGAPKRRERVFRRATTTTTTAPEAASSSSSPVAPSSTIPAHTSTLAAPTDAVADYASSDIGGTRLIVGDVAHSLLEWQDLDPTIKHLQALLINPKDPVVPKHFHRFAKHVSRRDDGVWLYKERVILPEILQDLIINEFHYSPLGGHFGVHSTAGKVSSRYWRPGLVKAIHEAVKTCDSCQKVKARHTPMYGLLQPLPLTSRLFERIGIDIVGPLPISHHDNRYLLVLVDYYSHWVEAFPLPEYTTERIARTILREIVPRFGCPETILSDRGASFLSQLAFDLYSIMGTEKITTTAYHPQTNGLCERMNGVIKTVLTHFVNTDRASWEDFLPWALFAYRTTPSKALGDLSPFQILYGQSPMSPLDRFSMQSGTTSRDYNLPQIHQSILAWRDKVETNLSLLRLRQQEAMKTSVDKHRRIPRFYVGQYVYLDNSENKLMGNATFTPRRLGPYIIISAAPGANVVQVARIDKRAKVTSVNVSRLLPASYKDIPTLSAKIIRRDPLSSTYIEAPNIKRPEPIHRIPAIATPNEEEIRLIYESIHGKNHLKSVLDRLVQISLFIDAVSQHMARPAQTVNELILSFVDHLKGITEDQRKLLRDHTQSAYVVRKKFFDTSPFRNLMSWWISSFPAHFPVSPRLTHESVAS